jgi:hypothetical protein
MKIKNVEIWIRLLFTLSVEFIYKTERDLTIMKSPKPATDNQLKK